MKRAFPARWRGLALAVLALATAAEAAERSLRFFGNGTAVAP